MLAYISVVDRLSTAIGKAFGWYVLILTFGTSYEVFVRYVLDNPTIWAYDLSYNMYGALFIMAGAYTLGRNAHVRGDVFYRLMPPRAQAGALIDDEDDVVDQRRIEDSGRHGIDRCRQHETSKAADQRRQQVGARPQVEEAPRRQRQPE